jgi:hypothetical protein
MELFECSETHEIVCEILNVSHLCRGTEGTHMKREVEENEEKASENRKRAAHTIPICRMNYRVFKPVKIARRWGLR